MSPKRIKICLWKYPVLIKFTDYRSANWLKLNFFTGTFQRFWPYNLCVKIVQIRSFFWSVFSAFGLNADIYSVNCRIQPECGKNIGLLCKTKQLLDNESLKSINFSYIHSYLNYANISWASANPRKLKKIHYLQKQAARIIIFNEYRLCHSRPLLNALNVYQVNLYQNLNFMHRIKMGNIPEVFHETIKKPIHKYPATFSNLNYIIKKYSLKSTEYSVSYRGPTFWNTILDMKEIGNWVSFVI